jgi:DNA-binding transcriptional ArsR family regulator
VVEDMAMDRTFHALAHGARRDMLRRLSDGDLTVGELAKPLDMSLAAASKHLQVLIDAGLVSQTVTGRNRVCRLMPGRLADATDWLLFYQRFWSQSLDALDGLLQRSRTPGKGSL